MNEAFSHNFTFFFLVYFPGELQNGKARRSSDIWYAFCALYLRMMPLMGRVFFNAIGSRDYNVNFLSMRFVSLEGWLYTTNTFSWAVRVCCSTDMDSPEKRSAWHSSWLTIKYYVINFIIFFSSRSWMCRFSTFADILRDLWVRV